MDVGSETDADVEADFGKDAVVADGGNVVELLAAFVAAKGALDATSGKKVHVKDIAERNLRADDYPTGNLIDVLIDGDILLCHPIPFGDLLLTPPVIHVGASEKSFEEKELAGSGG